MKTENGKVKSVGENGKRKGERLLVRGGSKR